MFFPPLQISQIGKTYGMKMDLSRDEISLVLVSHCKDVSMVADLITP